ncbi:MAG: hypothetical protein DRO00_07840 [Thermoproteota archaeon]|nr:MAG: hypothetical protein DRO00_07840 [Candidatus Korarchaeota archaeon]
MTTITKKNPFFEICLKDPKHPFHDKAPQTCKDCPDYDLCSKGELIDVDFHLVVDHKNIERLQELAKELKNRGFTVKLREEGG